MTASSHLFPGLEKPPLSRLLLGLTGEEVPAQGRQARRVNAVAFKRENGLGEIGAHSVPSGTRPLRRELVGPASRYSKFAGKFGKNSWLARAIQSVTVLGPQFA